MKTLRNEMIKKFIGITEENRKTIFYIIMLSMESVDKKNFLLALRQYMMDKIAEDKLLLDENNFEQYKKIVYSLGQLDIEEEII